MKLVLRPPKRPSVEVFNNSSAPGDTESFPATNSTPNAQYNAHINMENTRLDEQRKKIIQSFMQMTATSVSEVLHKECMTAMGYVSEEHPQYQNVLKKMNRPTKNNIQLNTSKADKSIEQQNDRAVDMSIIAARVKKRKFCPTNYARVLGWRKAILEYVQYTRYEEAVEYARGKNYENFDSTKDISAEEPEDLAKQVIEEYAKVVNAKYRFSLLR
ncbi:hypothetical protein O9G_005097 [Rozella allomycis CSF55]|uniref:Uncharacterized protein n=1 Tax=Rozella allomycis (strain CSF55) TaxID=988480 RepID=A0A075B3S2_ROZAC|nr:hypothetical protein O9G_005097 [Rozella allomycis CSF55]|eukprot:EPZ35548.1 hypothetical protein O9G_005097 [Rozella allomycis CSF55]